MCAVIQHYYQLDIGTVAATFVHQEEHWVQRLRLVLGWKVVRYMRVLLLGRPTLVLFGSCFWGVLVFVACKCWMSVMGAPVDTVFKAAQLMGFFVLGGAGAMLRVLDPQNWRRMGDLIPASRQHSYRAACCCYLTSHNTLKVGTKLRSGRAAPVQPAYLTVLAEPLSSVSACLLPGNLETFVVSTIPLALWRQGREGKTD